MRPVQNVFQKLSRTEQRREGVVAYLWFAPPTPPVWANFSIMMERTPESGGCHSVWTLWVKHKLHVQLNKFIQILPYKKYPVYLFIY
jgi:hypothetical protein